MEQETGAVVRRRWKLNVSGALFWCVLCHFEFNSSSTRIFPYERRAHWESLYRYHEGHGEAFRVLLLWLSVFFSGAVLEQVIVGEALVTFAVQFFFASLESTTLPKIHTTKNKNTSENNT